jgi:PAS domain S-box-containing protein
MLMASYAVFIYLVINIQQTFYFQRMIREADRFSAAIMNATNHSMLNDDAAATGSIVSDIAKQDEISAIRIFNHYGVIKFSNVESEIGTKVDKKAEACFACHSEDKPFSEVITNNRTRVHQHGNDRVLGMITPIYNRETCSSASCHIHPADQKVLGVLDIGMSLRNFDAHAHSLILDIALLGVGTCLAVLSTIGMYCTFRVHRPISKLRDAAMKIAVGDFNYKPLVSGEDQVAECSWAFNLMRSQIQRRTMELAQSREEYKNLFEQVPCFICVINKDFTIVRQNTLMRTLFKGSTGMHCYQVFKKSSTKCDDCHVDTTFREGTTSGKEHCGLKGTGEEANYLSYTTPIVNEEGRVLYAMLIAVDISDRVRLERALEASRDFQTNLIDNSIHGIVATDEHGRINIYNIAAQKIFGYSTAEVIGDTDLEKYFPRQFLEIVLAPFIGKESSEPRLVAQETAIIDREGEPAPVRFSGFVMVENGRKVGAVGFYQDLKLLKQLEREKQASDRLAVVGQTVAGLAHGIKNILTGLEGGVFVLETALEDKDEDLLKRGWKMIQSNIGRISQLVKDLLSYSRERAPEYEQTDPNVLVEEVCALFEIKAQEKSITIKRDFDPDVGRMFAIFLDQRGIHACLSNLIANAIDACEIDTKDVQHVIRVTTAQDSEGNLVLQVTDNGIGMNQETRKKIFASFYSTKGSRGTGLGLMVTNKIVLEHGGEISFDSEEGVGTTFTIILPYVEVSKNLGSLRIAESGSAQGSIDKAGRLS